MTLQVQSVRVRRFKNIKDLVLDLDSTTVLVGANNSGKSAVLQAIQFVTSAAQCVGSGGLQGAGDERTATISPTDLYYSPVEEVMTLSYGAPLTQNKDTAIQLDFTLNGGTSFYLAVVKGRNGNLSIRTTAHTQWDALSSLERPFSMYVPGLAGIAPAESYLTPAAVRKAAARGHGNAVLRNVLWQLKREHSAWNAFEQQLETVFPGHSVTLEHDPEQDDGVYVQVNTGDTSRPVGLAGTGLLQTLQILAYLNLYRPSILLLDEPDSHIHPDKQRSLLTVITEWAAAQSAKVIVATHSRHLLDSMDGNATFYWMQHGEKRNESNFDRVKVLMDLGALDRSDRLKHGQISGVVLTEDAAAADDHRKHGTNPLRKLLAASGVDLSRVQVWSYEGCTKADVARVLASFIVEHAPGARVLVHRDRDYLSDEEVAEVKADYAAAGVDAFITHGTDVESYFLSATHVAAATGLEHDEAEQLLDDATLETRSESLNAFTRAEMEREKVRRRAAGKTGEPSPAEVTQKCVEAFDAAPERYRHGKRTLRVLRRMIQEKHGNQADLLTQTGHISADELRKFANAVAAPTPVTQDPQALDASLSEETPSAGA